MQKIFLLFTYLLWGIVANAELTTPPKSVESSYSVLKNVLKNPGAELGKTDWTASAGTYTIETTAANVFAGSRSFSWDPSAASETFRSGVYALPAYQNAIASCRIQTAATDLLFTVEDDSAVEIASLTVRAGASSEFLNIFVPFPTGSGSATYRISIESASDSAVVKIDDCYLGLNHHLFSAFIQDGWTAYTPVIGATTTAPGEGAGAVKTAHWRRNGPNMEIFWTYRQAATGTEGSGAYKMPLPTGYSINLAVAPAPTTLPTATVIGIGGATVGKGTIKTTSAGDTNFSGVADVIVFDATNLYMTTIAGSALVREFPFGSSNALDMAVNPLQFSFFASVPIAGWDNGQYAVKADQTDYGWTSYTPTFTGLGTVTSIDCKHRRVSEELEVQCKFTTGTHTATEARISFPNSLVARSTIPTLQLASGPMGRTETVQAFVMLAAEPSVSYFTFVNLSGTTSSIAKILGNSMASTHTFSVYAHVPIQGWQANHRAPSLIGSVTSSSSSSLRFESARLNCDAGSAITAQTGSMVSSIGNISAGACAVNFTASQFSSAPYCSALVETGSGGDPLIIGLTTAPTTSAVSVDCSDNAGTDCTAYDFELMCMGAR